jgi:DNA invertase Pin-like site-specific DNA recombinase
MTIQNALEAAEAAELLTVKTPVRYVYPDALVQADRPRAVVYCRQSRASADDSQASPEMQRTSAEAHCVAQGYSPVACFTDVGKSGWNPKVTRPAFEEMMQWVRDGKCDVVVIYELRRLTRQGAHEALKIESEMRDNGVALVSVREPYLDTGSPVGVGIFAILAGLAKQESDLKSEYITDTRDLARKVGGHVSGPAPYGTRAEKLKTETGVAYQRLVPVEDEARVIRRMVDMVMDGKSVGKVAVALNDDGIKTPAQREIHAGRKGFAFSKPTPLRPAGAPPVWSATQVFRTLRDPRIAGMAADKVHGGSTNFEIRRDDAGVPLAPHEPIITPAEWFTLQSRLSSEGSRHRTTRGEATHLLSGWDFLHCPCGAGATCSGATRPGGRTYRCSRNSEYRKAYNHTGLSVMADAAEDHIAGAVFARMLALDVEDENDAELLGEVTRRFAMTGDSVGLARELTAVRAQLDHTTRSIEALYEDKDVHKLYEGKIGRASFARALSALNTVEAECRNLAADLESAMTGAAVLPIEQWCGGFDMEHGDYTGPGSPWSTWTVAFRREFLSLWLDGVTMLPAEAWRPPIAHRLELHWAKPAEDDQDDD